MSVIIDQSNFRSFSVGKKAENLFVMRENGINVPELFCVTDSDPENLGEYSECLDGDMFAVRSSAFAEDGDTYSYAGQYRSFLFVPKEQLKEKIRESFLSSESENLKEYQRKSGVKHEGGMCVIIEKMISADFSGVLFSANPQGILNESVIIVGQGTGNNVVEEKEAVTTYYFNNTDQVWYYEASENSPLISKEMVLELIDISERLQKLFGPLIDVEFAVKEQKIFILQCRNITTMNTESPLILDNSNIAESYPGVSLPLTISFVKEAYSGVFRGVVSRCLKNKNLTEQFEDIFQNMVGASSGRLYYKISNWYSLLLMLPFSRKILPVWQEMMGVTIRETSEVRPKTGKLQNIFTVFHILSEMRKIPQNMRKLELDFDRVSDDFSRSFHSGMSNEDLAELYGRISDEVLKNWDITLLNDLYAFIFTGAVRFGYRKRFPHCKEEEINSYISGISEIESMKPMQALAALGCYVSEHGLIQRISQIQNDVQAFLFLQEDTEFSRKCADYIRLYGDRVPEELKLETDTFRTSPMLFFKRIREYTCCFKTSDIREAEHKKSGLLLGFLSRHAEKGISNREVSRLNRTRIYGMMRSIFIEIGKNFYDCGEIAAPRDIFYLTVNEIFGKIYGNVKDDLNGRISTRKTDCESFRKLPAYSRLIFEKSEFDKRGMPSCTENIVLQDKGIIIGTPCSGGEAVGEVLVIDDVSVEIDTVGKILVTKMTDPGWVLFLASARGIISEKGSLLSHTAIISRELKIPSVVGVKNAAKIFKTGQVIKMNGNTGEIYADGN